MGFRIDDENRAYATLLGDHLKGFAIRLSRLPEAQWDWTPDPAAPTARILAAHTWQWLVCDRYHLEEPDIARHPRVPDPPADPQAMIAELEAEAARWRAMILGFTPEDFARPVWQFGEGEAGNVRGFVCHMIQNAIYKHGQFSTLFFALGLDGSNPYDAPWPNPIYEEVREGNSVSEP